MKKQDDSRTPKIDIEMLKTRKAAIRVSEVPQDVLFALNKGLIPSKNLAEILAVDSGLLLTNLHFELGLKMPNLAETVKKLSKEKILAQLQTGAQFFLTAHIQFPEAKVLERLSGHPSDMARSWAVYLSGVLPAKNLKTRFEILYPYAADLHMGVREYAWMVLRPFVVANFKEALPYLKQWAQDPDANVRRCAMESTRPKGVWCQQFPLMQEKPALAIPLLETLRNDSSRYVQNSVANWLNDASKSQPKWVMSLCAKWKKESKTIATDYIVKRALRTLNK